MALAPFFDRARQGAAQVLRDFDAAAFERRLDEVLVDLVFDDRAAGTPEGRCALDMAARLAARLYPRVAVSPLDGDEPLAGELRALMLSINPAIDFGAAEGTRLRVAVVFGCTEVVADACVHVGSDGWLARVSSLGPVGCGDTINPFGAGAAACIGMANVFRRVFAAHLPKAEPDAEATLSLLDFATGPEAANDALPDGVDIGLVQLVGAGAIGNGFVWAMARAAGVEGVLHLIDPETVDDTNPQRYVLTGAGDVEASKVALAAAALSDTRLVAEAFACTWADYVAGVGHHRFENVAVALDTARDRVQVQGALPRRILNAWTQAGDLGVSRHGFDGEEACLACLYLPRRTRRNEDEIVLEELGLPAERLLEVRAMLHLGQPVGAELVSQIAAAKGVDPAILMPFVGLPLRAFRQRAICGNALMRAQDGGGTDIEVPMAFQSALAGVMLAAETVASVGRLRAAEPATRTVIDLMRRLPALVTTCVRKGGPGPARCICEDPDYVAAYRLKYAEELDAVEAKQERT